MSFIVDLDLARFRNFTVVLAFIFYNLLPFSSVALQSNNLLDDPWRKIDLYETQFQDCLLSRIPPMMAQKVSFVGFQIYLTAICVDERKALRDAVLYFGPVIWPKKSRDEILVLYDYKERFSRDEAIRAHVKAMGFE